MQVLAEFDEAELELLNALQIHPRASWSLLGEVLQADPATVARRWARLENSGRAWIAVVPGFVEPAEALCAFIEVECEAGAAHGVAERLVTDPRVGSVEHMTGSFDLLLTVIVRDLAALSAYVLTVLGRIDGVRSTSAHVATALHTEGSQWQVRALGAAQCRRIATALPGTSVPARPLDERDRSLLTALTEDGRASYSTLSARTGMSISTVRRRLDALLTHRRAVLRCEVARPLSGWPFSVSLWCRVPYAQLDTVAAQLAALPETRLCAAITGGRPNLLVTTWLRSLGDIQALQATLSARIDGFEVEGCSLALSQSKRVGHVLDARGAAVGRVPVTAWPAPGV
ncbi:Lrp/AsnC family transcriptional regulator [Streptomyces sp. NPDC015127]|uniref:Lrp/AsnC family transcriptional regulator n=1 Tax=Streptomyces sp. NPDC015127 TaxID=3364939 RepID=UPI0036FAC437